MVAPGGRRGHGQLPFARQLSDVDARRGTPLWRAVIIGALAVALLAINIGNPALFTTLSSVCIVMLYLAYLLLTAPLLVRRLRAWPVREPGHKGLFSLGRWGLPINAVAVLYGAAMVVNLAWPRPEVYDPTGEHPWLVWSAPTVVLTVLAVGAVARAAAQRRRSASPAPVPAAG